MMVAPPAAAALHWRADRAAAVAADGSAAAAISTGGGCWNCCGCRSALELRRLLRPAAGCSLWSAGCGLRLADCRRERFLAEDVSASG
jgi:hypothetical protein